MSTVALSSHHDAAIMRTISYISFRMLGKSLESLQKLGAEVDVLKMGFWFLKSVKSYLEQILANGVCDQTPCLDIWCHAVGRLTSLSTHLLIL